MSRSHFDVQTWLTGYSGWSFYCALISVFGVTGYYCDLLRQYVPDWVVVGLLIAPITIILFIQWGELPDRVVAASHIIAASWFMILALGTEVGHFLGYQPYGSGLYRILAHLGWTFAWAGIYRRARRSTKRSVEPDVAPNRRAPLKRSVRPESGKHPMKKIMVVTSVLMVASCVPTPSSHEQTIQTPASGTPSERIEYEQHIQRLAFGTPREQIEIALSALESAGTAAYPTLVAHFKDSTRAADRFQVQDVLWDLGHPSIGDVCFDIIQGQVEGRWPKGYRQYPVLTPENARRWLDVHQGLSLRELRIAAAQESLRRAESKIRQRTADDYQKGVLKFLRDNLQKAQE